METVVEQKEAEVAAPGSAGCSTRRGAILSGIAAGIAAGIARAAGVMCDAGVVCMDGALELADGLLPEGAL